MRNNVGLVALFTAFVAFVGISNFPRGAPEREAVQASTRSSKSPQSNKQKNKAQTDETSLACEEIARRLRVFIYPNNFDQIGKDRCLPGASGLPSNVRFVIATVPSPVSTHLALMFDRAIDTIQQAAEDENYSYDSSWFPWNEVAKEYSSFDDQQQAEKEEQEQEEQPGLVVFRGPLDGKSPYDSGLIVFVVSETPTGGVDRHQFQNALELVRGLGNAHADDPLRVLGPMFSGSLPSLDQALASVSKINVFSGSVSSEQGKAWFAGRIGSRGRFQSAMSGDRDMVERFLGYLERQGYGRGCVAIISEDETAFGNNPGDLDDDQVSGNGAGAQPSGENKNPADIQVRRDSGSGRCDLFGQNPKPIYLYYPRDIATLRSAYERQSIFGSKKASSDGATTSTSLRSDLTEPENSNHDTVRSYGGQLTPLAQEAVLQNIANTLKEKAIQFIVVRSTNSLDQVFLSQFFRRADPEARVVLDGADLLFKRGAEGTSLRGVMVLSTYPLLTPWQQDWTVALRYRKNGSYRIFGEDAAEGLYVAARELFRTETSNDATEMPSSHQTETSKAQIAGSSMTGASRTGVPINDYGPPSWAGLRSPNQNSQRAGAWLSVIGHRQFWPIAFLDSDTQYKITNGGDKRQTGMPAPTKLARDLPIPSDETLHPPVRFTIDLILLFVACLAWSACHFEWCSRGSISPSPAFFRTMYFFPLERVQHAGLIVFGSLLPASLAVVTAAVGGLVAYDVGRRLVFGAWIMAILMICILACIRNYRLPVCAVPGTLQSASDTKGNIKAWHVAGTIGTLCLALFAMLQLSLASRLNPGNEIPTYWRAIHLINGVSPLTPQILLIVGLYLWFWYSLRGLALFGRDRPLLPANHTLPPALRILARTQAANTVEEAAIPATRGYFSNLGIIFLVVLTAFTLAMESIALRTLGERAFGILMFVWFSLCVAIIVADMIQLWTTWRHLLQLLRYLDRLPLRRTLASLRGLTWSSVWEMSSNVLQDRYSLISRQLESLTHLRNSIRESKELRLRTKVDALKEIGKCRRKVRDFSKWYVSLSRVGTASGGGTGSVDMSSLAELQEALADTAAYTLVHILLPAWRSETESLIFDRHSSEDVSKSSGNEKSSASDIPTVNGSVPQYVLAGEEFFVLPYVGFIQNTLGRIRTIVLGSLCLFVATTLAASSYPFDPLPVLGGIFLTVFAIAGGASMVVLAQMHRDSTLSHITNTSPGELGSQFWIHLITFGVGPLLGLLTTLFPSITDFVSSWLQPSMQALK